MSLSANASSPIPASSAPLLQAEGVTVRFDACERPFDVVRDVSFTLHPGRTLCLVGESGCGKSMTALSLLRLIPEPGRLAAGRILFEGRDLAELSESAMERVRGRDIGMIFQEPMTSLNPVFTIGNQLDEVTLRHVDGATRETARKKSLEMLSLVGIAMPDHVYASYPHQLSGGMRQRVMIAMALCCNPKLIIADEPTTALDVTIQAQILDLLRDVKNKISGSIMLITHDLGVIAEMVDYVVVMYAGRVVEKGTAQEIFANPAHPYTIGLMASKPMVGKKVDKLYSIPGKVPNPINMPNYCYFKDRCEMCVDGCQGEYPHMIQLSPTHMVSCYRYYGKEDAQNG